jgi:ABC-2 type transport system ATP-binding protein
MADAITVTDLVVKRGHLTVLNGFNCSVAAGRVTGLLGPNGSGKTTLLRSIVGAQIVASGRITVFGLPAGSAALRHRIGYATQAPSIYGDLTVRQNALYFAAVYGLGSAAAKRAVADVGLTDAADQLVANLSGGQMNRASLACAIIAKPDLLVLDEPTVGQDPILREDMWAQFNQLAADGAALMISSHVMDEASRCQELLLIRRGELIADGTPAEVRAKAGTDDLGEAFLRLIRRQEGEAA